MFNFIKLTEWGLGLHTELPDASSSEFDWAEGGTYKTLSLDSSITFPLSLVNWMNIKHNIPQISLFPL